MRVRAGHLLLVLLLGQAAIASSQDLPARPQDREPFIRETRDILEHELVPNFKGTFKGAPFRTNRWGMRDRDYTMKPAPGTFRIAFVGSSLTMGGGVRDEKTHEWLLEERLNRERPGARARYEVLNFSVGGYGVLQTVAVIEKKVFAFSPDVIILVIHDVERFRVLKRLTEMLREGVPIESAYLRRKIDEAGVSGRMQEPEIRRRLRRVADDIVTGSYEHAADLSRRHGVRLVGLVFPIPQSNRRADLPAMARLAAKAGIHLLRLEGVYDGIPYDSIRLSDQDNHLNERGHRVVTDRLYELLRSDDDRALRVGFSKAR